MSSKTLLERAAALLGNGKFELALGEFVEKYESKLIVLPIFKTIKLGVYKNIDQFQGVFNHLKNKISNWALKLFSKAPISSTEVEIDLVKVSVQELTGKKEATCKEICDMALSPKFGLQFCEPEDALCLRVAYQEQPENEILFMGMEPIVSGGGHCLFYAGRSGGVRWLGASHCGHAGDVWVGSGVFVFRRPRKVS